MAVVLDASAMIALLRGEAGAQIVLEEIQSAGNAVFAHALNLCEVFYDFARASGDEIADRAMKDLAMLGIQTREDLQSDFWREMGRLKSEYRRVSLADCACLTLAAKLQAKLLTADHHELARFHAGGLYDIVFIR